jgi:hypothetical protein
VACVYTKKLSAQVFLAEKLLKWPNVSKACQRHLHSKFTDQYEMQVVQMIQMLVFQLGQLEGSEPITPRPISTDSSSGIGAMPRADSPLPFPQDFQVVRGSVRSRQQVPLMRRCLKPAYIYMLCDELMAIHQDIQHNHRNKYKVRTEVFIGMSTSTNV